MSDGGRWMIRWSAAPLAPALLDVDGLVDAPGTRVLKRNPRTTVAVVDVGGAKLVLKRFEERGPRRWLEGATIGSGAARVRRGARRLRAAGFAAPELVAVLECRVLGVAVRSCAVTRLVEGTPLDELWRSQRGAQRRGLTIAFADWLRALHAARVYPQDLRAANLIVTDEPRQFVLVDLDRVRRHWRLSWPRRRKNVVQVHRSVGRGAPASAGVRFLRRYLGDPDRAILRRVAREIVAQGRVKDAEYARRRGQAAARVSVAR
jgi:hypothetical protein